VRWQAQLKVEVCARGEEEQKDAKEGTGKKHSGKQREGKGGVGGRFIISRIGFPGSRDSKIAGKNTKKVK